MASSEMTVSPLRVAFNGKFLSASPTGVHRVAAEIISALDRRLAQDSELNAHLDAIVLAPRNAKRDLGLQKIPVRTGSLLTGQFWEQLELPFRTRGRLLVSLCNLAPIATREAVTMIHDAQVHLTPQSYSRPFRVFYKTVQPLMGRLHRRILTVSSYSRDQLDLAGVSPKDKTTVVHNGSDHLAQVAAQPGAAATFGLTAKQYVLARSNTQPHKNIKVLLDAFALPPLSDYTLALFGGAGKEAFAAAGLSVPDNVAFLGPVSDEALVALMNDALCLGFPSTTEGFGLPPLEAMACGCPVLVAPCGALPEVCGEAAQFVAPDAPHAWVDAILDIALHSEQYDKWVAAGRRHAQSFTWARAADALVTVLEQVAPSSAA